MIFLQTNVAVKEAGARSTGSRTSVVVEASGECCCVVPGRPLALPQLA